MVELLYVAIVFLVIALIAYVLGLRGVAFFSAGIGKLVLWIFLILFLLSLLFRFLACQCARIALGFWHRRHQGDARKAARVTLGLAENENDIEVINKAYKAMARDLHPDMESGDIDKFKLVNNAHKTLKRELS